MGVRDHGGTGAPVLLLHGAGADRTAWDAVAPGLVPAHRVVAVDLRGHGLSGTGPWTWETVVDDLDTAVAALQLHRPAVVGHSVGGLVAARWTGRHPDCPAAVSLDGHRVAGTDPAHLAPAAGDDEEAVAAAGARFAAWLESLFARPGSGSPDARAAASAAARAALRDDDLASLDAVAAPFLVVVAERDPAGLPAEWAPMMRAFRAGLRRDVGALARAHPHLAISSIDATHGMIAEHPREVVATVTRFLAAPRTPPA